MVSCTRTLIPQLRKHGTTHYHFLGMVSLTRKICVKHRPKDLPLYRLLTQVELRRIGKIIDLPPTKQVFFLTLFALLCTQSVSNQV